MEHEGIENPIEADTAHAHTTGDEHMQDPDPLEQGEDWAWENVGEEVPRLLQHEHLEQRVENFENHISDSSQ